MGTSEGQKHFGLDLKWVTENLIAHFSINNKTSNCIVSFNFITVQVVMCSASKE